MSTTTTIKNEDFDSWRSEMSASYDTVITSRVNIHAINDGDREFVLIAGFKLDTLGLNVYEVMSVGRQMGGSGGTLGDGATEYLVRAHSYQNGRKRALSPSVRGANFDLSGGSQQIIVDFRVQPLVDDEGFYIREFGDAVSEDRAYDVITHSRIVISMDR